SLHGSDGVGAEAAWAQAADLQVRPTASSYRTLMQVYMRDGGAAQLAQAEATYSRLQHAEAEASLTSEADAAALQLQADDYEQLLLTAHAGKLHTLMRTWSQRAREAGMWPRLHAACRRT